MTKPRIPTCLLGVLFVPNIFYIVDLFMEMVFALEPVDNPLPVTVVQSSLSSGPWIECCCRYKREQNGLLNSFVELGFFSEDMGWLSTNPNIICAVDLSCRLSWELVSLSGELRSWQRCKPGSSACKHKTQ